MLRQLGGWLRSSHSFKECVIAHQSSDLAPKMVGAKPSTEAKDSFDLRVKRLVGERSESCEAGAKAFRWSGGTRGSRDEYARNRVKTPVTESLRVPEPCRSTQG